jgi:hypothetical protein
VRIHEKQGSVNGELENEPFFPGRPSERPLPEPMHHADEAARLYAQNAVSTGARSDATSAAPRANDDVLYLGMNTAKGGSVAQNDREWNNLVGVKKERVEASRSGKIDGFDLSDEKQRLGFCKTLGLPDEQAERIAKVIESANPEGREELAGIAKVLARGERGEKVPSRWILSGHTGNVIRDGDSPNQIDVSDVRALAKVMPQGAAYVEDILVSGCFSGGKEQLEAWKDAFPNVRSVVGYGTSGSFTEGDKSPTEAWAVAHITKWLAATKGRGLPTSALQHERGILFQNISYWDGSYHPAISHK